MKRTHAGYSPLMAKVRNDLRQMGLPDTLFDADFAEKEKAAKEQLQVLLERAREIEKTGSFTGDSLSSSELCRQFEAELAAAYTTSQGKRPKFLRYFQDTLNLWTATSSGRGAESDKRSWAKRKGSK